MLFPANLLTSTGENETTTRRTTAEIYNKPRLTQITKFTTTQNNHTSGTQNTITQNKLKQLKSSLTTSGLETERAYS